jgi:hypothetical protein
MRLYLSPLLFALVAALLTPISAGAQIDAECVAVHDFNGIRVARADNADRYIEIHLSHQGRVVVLRVGRDEFVTNGTVYFTDANCTDGAFMTTLNATPASLARVVGTDVWYPDQTFPLATRLPASSIDTRGNCVDQDTPVDDTVPAFNFTLPTFTPPFHLEPEPCFIPDDPDPEQVINGCVKESGLIKVVNDPAECLPNETPISWLSQ